MKRSIIIAIIATAATSCTISSFYETDRNNRDSRNIIEYSKEVLDKFGIGQTSNLIYLQTLDQYLKLTQEEQNQPEWANFKSKIEHYTDTYLRIPSRGIIVDTRGLSFTEPGTSWTMEITDDYDFMGYEGYHHSLLGSFGRIPGHSGIFRITCTGENTYEIIDEAGGKDIMFLSIEAIPSPYGGCDFTGSGSGRILENKRGLSATYTISEIYYRKHRIDEDGTGNSSVTVTYDTESLQFRLDTYHNGQELDWCELTKKTGSSLEYKTSLPDSDGSRFYF